jgi:hypothetical protein
MKKSELKQLIKETIREISFPEAPFTHISVKPILHLAHYKGEFVPVTQEDVASLANEFGPTNYGKPYKDDPTMRYLEVKEVIGLLDLFNIFLTED